jgi:hypothetical protein
MGMSHTHFCAMLLVPPGGQASTRNYELVVLLLGVILPWPLVIVYDL